MLDRSAVRDIAPAVLGALPFGLFLGVTIGTHPVGPVLGLASAALFYGGAAHLSALTVIAAGAAPPTVLAAVVAVNARLVLYGAALAPRFAGQPAWFRWLGPVFLIDQTFAAATALPPDVTGARFRRYWLTSGAVLGTGWLGAHVLGLLAGPALPSWLPLDVAGPAILVGLLVPHLRGRGVQVALVSGTVAATAAALPAGVGTLVGALAGLSASAVGRRRS